MFFLLSQYNEGDFQLYLACLPYRCKRGQIANSHHLKDKMFLNDNYKVGVDSFGILLLIIFLLCELMILAVRCGTITDFYIVPIKDFIWFMQLMLLPMLVETLLLYRGLNHMVFLFLFLLPLIFLLKSESNLILSLKPLLESALLRYIQKIHNFKFSLTNDTQLKCFPKCIDKAFSNSICLWTTNIFETS